MAKANMSPTRNEMPTQDPVIRAANFNEVALGYSEETAIDEALRCLNCKNAPCVAGCPVNIHIPEFIAKIREGDYEGAYQIITKSSSLPAVCGRVSVKCSFHSFPPNLYSHLSMVVLFSYQSVKPA
mgnify:CR=1 FL=1